jgi:hypothetical protein
MAYRDTVRCRITKRGAAVNLRREWNDSRLPKQQPWIAGMFDFSVARPPLWAMR